MPNSGTWALAAFPVVFVFGPSALRLVVYIPLWVSFGIVISAVCLINALLRRVQPGATSVYRRRYGLRPLAFTTPSAWSAALTRQAWDETSVGKARISSNGQSKSQRLYDILSLVRSTFVLPWYDRISPSPAFPNAVQDLILEAIDNISEKSNHVDWSTLLVSRIVPHITSHVHHSVSVEHLTSSTTTQDTPLPLPLPGKVHPALSHQAHVSSQTAWTQVESHFREVIGRVVDEALPEQDRSEVVKTIVREILLGTVILPVFEMLSDSDFWNRQIDERGGQYLREQYVLVSIYNLMLTV